VGVHLNLLLWLSKQETLLSLSGVFLLLGKTKCWLSNLKLTSLSSVWWTSRSKYWMLLKLMYSCNGIWAVGWSLWFSLNAVHPHSTTLFEVCLCPSREVQWQPGWWSELNRCTGRRTDRRRWKNTGLENGWWNFRYLGRKTSRDGASVCYDRLQMWHVCLVFVVIQVWR